MEELKPKAYSNRFLSFRELVSEVINFARHRIRNQFNFSEDDADESELIDTVRKSVSLRGANLWVLIFAIIIASVGLNINSTAAIIGAMLISPLMGPIMGIGFGAAIIDFDLVKSSARNLGLAVLGSVLASTVYFSISPLSRVNSELLARTTPTVYDVLVAFFGGLAVMIASTRKSKSTSVIAGASIATALMPPLCTAGYSLANHNLRFFSGAIFLFLINCIYISLATYLVTRMLGIRHTQGNRSAALNKYLPRVIAGLAILTLVPSIFLAYQLVKREMLEQEVETFVAQEILSRDIHLLQRNFEYRNGKYLLKLVVLGDHKKTLEADLSRQLPRYGLDKVELRIEDTLTEKPMNDLSALKSGVLEELVVRNEKLIKLRDDEIASLKQDIANIENERVNEDEILAELLIMNPGIEKLGLQRRRLGEEKYELLGYIEVSKPLTAIDQEKIKAWLKVRTKSENVRISLEIVPPLMATEKS